MSSNKPVAPSAADHLIHEVDEELQQERILQLWAKHKRLIIGGVAAIIIGTAGWTSWQSHRTERLTEATMGLYNIIEKSGSDWQKTAEQLGAFAADRRGTAQATLAQLQEAAVRLDHGQKTEALALYDAISKDKGADSALRQLADLLWARTQLDDGDAASLRARLTPLTKGTWHYSAQEALGLLAMREKDFAGARAIFVALREDAGAPADLRQRATQLARAVAE